MSLRYIVLLLDGGGTDAKQRLAFDIAQRHNAQLHGIFVIPPPAPRAGARSGAGPGVSHAPGLTADLHRGVVPGSETPASTRRSDSPGHDPVAAAEQRAEQARHSFERALTSAGLDGSFETLSTGRPNKWLGILEQNRICDLLISGKPDDGGEDRKNFQRFVTQSGMPVLIVPDSAREWSGRNVAIGWNGSPGVMRAMRAAFPLIEECKSATVVMTSPKSGVVTSSRRLQEVLGAHGLECDEQRDLGGELKTSDVLVSRAEMSDLLIAGAYGRSRLHEMILGGTTGNIVQHATMPLLIAH